VINRFLGYGVFHLRFIVMAPRSLYRFLMQYVAFLRGMNLGKRRLEMSKLRALFEELGFRDVSTFIASGNVIFGANTKDRSKLESRIAAHLQSSLRYEVETFVRTADETAKIANGKTFPEDGQAGIKVHVAFMKEKLSPSTARKLEAIDTGYDHFRADGTEFYWLTRGPISESEVWTQREVKELGLPSCTMRNMTSIRKLAGKLAGARC